jgi:hypothetical protein
MNRGLKPNEDRHHLGVSRISSTESIHTFTWLLSQKVYLETEQGQEILSDLHLFLSFKAYPLFFETAAFAADWVKATPKSLHPNVSLRFSVQ